MRVRRITDFRFSAFYYPEVRAALAEAKRLRLPEHTEDDPEDPIEALLDLQALIGHRDFVLLDHAARETMLPTLRLRSSVVGLSGLVGYRLAPASAATADVLLELSAPPASSSVVCPSLSTFAATGAEAGEEIVFEYTGDDITITPLTSFVAAQTNGGVTTAYTWGASLLGGAPSEIDRDAVYVGHPDTMFNGIVLPFSSYPVDVIWRVEYADEIRTLPPDSVEDLGGTIRMNVAAAVGAAQASVGLSVTVTCLRTGQSETLITTSPSIITTTTVLGQSVVSEEPGDYEIRTEWARPENVTLTQDGTSMVLRWDLPEGASRKWERREVAGVAAFWLRIRVLYVGISAAVGTLAQPSTLGRGKPFVRLEVVQGQQQEEVLGTGDGTASQQLDLPEVALLSVAGLTVGGEEWVEVEDLLASSSFDRHFVVVERVNGTRYVLFGDGERGRVAPSSAEVVAQLRVGGDVSGNVGVAGINRARNGLPGVVRVRNPRAGVGWAPPEGSTAEDLEALRFRIPRWVRTNDRIVTVEDAEAVAEGFRMADGEQPVYRAAGRENGSGPNTIRLVCVAGGDGLPDADGLAELDEVMNGRLAGIQRVGGAAMAGLYVEAVPYIPRQITPEVTVSVDARFEAGAQAAVIASLRASLRPLARRLEILDDGTVREGADYQWRPGGTVSVDVLVARLGLGVRGFLGAAWTTPAADVSLAADELPTCGTPVVTITAVET